MELRPPHGPTSPEKVAAAAIATWLASAICPAVRAADGAQTAAAAKEAAVNMQAYLRDLEKSGGQPDYSKPPASEYLKRIFDADGLRQLPAPKADDLSWLSEWGGSVSQTYIAMLAFGAKNQTDTEAMARNLFDHQDHTFPAIAFLLRLGARSIRTMSMDLNSLPPNQRTEARKEDMERSAQSLLLQATGASSTIRRAFYKRQNVRLMAAALRDTVTVWAPLATSQERATILAFLEEARTANKNAGIDDDITAIATAIKNVKE